MVVYSKVKLPIMIGQVQSELSKIAQNWTAHFNTRHYNGSWTVLPLRTPDGTDSIFPELIHAHNFEYHANILLFPSIRKFVDALKCEVNSIRLLNLTAGSVIKEHRDVELAFEKGEARLHIPIVTNPEIEFYVNGERLIMRTGECWYINANLPHRVANKGNTDRIHLVIDCIVNPWLQQQILGSDHVVHAPDESKNPELLQQMIAALKFQNTPAAKNLSIELQQQYDLLTASK